MTTKPTTIILSGFALVIILVISLLVISLYQFKLSKTTIENGILKEGRHTLISNTLQEITHKRSVLMLKLLQSKDTFEKDEIAQTIYNLGETFMLRRTELLSDELDLYEHHLLNTHKEESKLVVPFQHRVIELSLADKETEALNLFLTKSLPLQQQNTRYLNDLSGYQNNEIRETTFLLVKQLNDISFIIITTGVIVIIFCISIATFIYRRLTRNINELHITHKALSDSLSSLQNIEHALDEHAIVSIADTSSRITYVNDKFCEISQYNENELLGQPHSIVNSGYHNKTFFRNMMTTIYSGETWHGEIRNRKKDGSYYWVETTIVPFLDDNGIPYQYIAIRTDVSKLVNTEQELAQSLEQLAAETEKALESSALKSAIISTMTHELKTPLNSILGFSQLLLLDEDKLSEMQTDNIRNILESGQELTYNIDNIMLYSKLKSNTIELQTTLVDLDLLIQAIIDDSHFHNYSSTVFPVLQSHYSLETTADMTLLRKAFHYIIDNAIKFTVRGTVDIRITKINQGEPLPDHDKTAATGLILIAIEDTGVGIPAEKLDIIFDEFRQVEEKDNRQFEGVGIGLSLAKSIINLHRGDIWLTSAVNSGTTVYITLPH
ncbi:MAG: ATP-binding protein [Gammaproteobacteria bacterium]|nr:ATP-binding protein [Gammaproteobacteria bacterium]